ncbi:zinc finger protein 888-like [Folsomia candida]|uniref:zinc finger protein 888-like n=1 Tax=Folsomia candida TaxID=158441 RepID=UPI001604D40E|nr:zinc finger protein 888-like [Folsomia candida]
MDNKSVTKSEGTTGSKMLEIKANHHATHDPDDKVKCQVGGKILNPRGLSSHVSRLHTHRKSPSCDICHRVFFEPRNFRRHIAVIHGTSERPRFPCTFLGSEKTYQNKRQISHHVKTEHAENPVRFPCTLCGNEFKTRGNLSRHILTHTTEKPYNCATCARSFARRSHVKSHEMTHLEKSTRARSKCHVCPQTFLRRADLLRHIRVVHENQRNFPCLFCDKIFARTSQVKGYVEAVHPAKKEKTHSCDKCEYKTHTKANLTLHVRRHNVANWRECYFCKKQFARFQGLVTHYSRIHCLEI